MNVSKHRVVRLAGIALAVLMLLTLVLAPSGVRLSSGSTYSRAPDGYGAWYAFMEKRGTPIQRWQRPLAVLEHQTAITLLRVRGNSSQSGIAIGDRKWIEKGNTLVILGVWQPVTEAPFSTQLESSQGNVKIETRRRASGNNGKTQLLGDHFGAVVWKETLDKGQVIWVTTPYLAANAYQNEPGNYAFLAQLLTETNQPIWVDEYIHGYRDPDAQDEETAVRNWLEYLARTPLVPIAIQGGIVLLVAIVAQNRRFGCPQTIDPLEINNSQAYIQALASVLRKAQSSKFVAQTVGKAEQLVLQERLGLGSTPLEPEALLKAWEAQTGRDAAELQSLLRLSRKRRWKSERELLTWLEKWQAIRKL